MYTHAARRITSAGEFMRIPRRMAVKQAYRVSRVARGSRGDAPTRPGLGLFDAADRCACHEYSVFGLRAAGSQGRLAHGQRSDARTLRAARARDQAGDVHVYSGGGFAPQGVHAGPAERSRRSGRQLEHADIGGGQPADVDESERTVVDEPVKDQRGSSSARTSPRSECAQPL